MNDTVLKGSGWRGLLGVGLWVRGEEEKVRLFKSLNFFSFDLNRISNNTDDTLPYLITIL